MAATWDKLRVWLSREPDQGAADPHPDELPEAPRPAPDGGGGGQSDQDAFALALVDAARAVGATDLVYDADEFCIRGPDASVSWLQNRFEDYRSSSEEDQARLLRIWAGQLLPSAGQVPESWSDAAPRLRPRVRGRIFLETVSLGARLEGRNMGRIPWQPLCDHLVVTLVCDHPTMMSSVTDEMLAAWGVDADRAFARALDNLRTDQTPVAVASLGDGLRIVHVGDDYDSSRMLLPELLAQLDLDGRLVALPATRSHLFVASDDDPDALGLLLDLALKVRDEVRLDTLRPVVFRGGSWHPWQPSPDHPRAAAWQRLIADDQTRDWEEQHQLLRELLERNGIDAAAASAGIYEDDDGIRLVAALGPGRVLLPEVDRVLLLTPAQDAFVDLSWTELRRALGPRMRRDPDRWPVRWLVEGGPDEGTWQQLLAEHAPVLVADEQAPARPQ